VNSQRIYTFRGAVLAGAALLLFSVPGSAQQAPPSTPTDATSIRELQVQIRELQRLVEAMRVENAQSRAEMGRLREDLQATRVLLEKPAATGGTAATTAAAPAEAGTSAPAGNQASTALEQRVEKLEESTSLIGEKVDEQHETNVETASKYRARLHGIILMNAFRNIGSSDSLDLPSYAEPVPRGWPVANVAATLRQSEVGLEIFGPTVAGAKTSADVQLDFAGGFPDTGNGVNFGLARLQTASLRLDWQHTSVVAGQDTLFLSPLSPTSFASLALPAFAFAGNLWAWTPQLRVEHRFSVSDRQTITLQAGVFDNLNWEFPNNQFNRTPQAGELSGQPAYGFRTAWSHAVNDHSLSFGAAGYYGRQNWTWGRYVDAWAGMADWEIPLLSRLELSGEFYRGVGIGGLGAAVGTSIVYGGNPRFPFSPIRGVDTAGGWAQLKFRLTPKLEFNGAVSDDDAFTGNIRGFATDAYNFGLIIGRNRGALANLVFRPRSDLILAGEFRRLRTFPVYSSSSMTNQASVSAGILF
jgi:hypothetical protein